MKEQFAEVMSLWDSFTLMTETFKYSWSLLHPSTAVHWCMEVDGQSYKTIITIAKTIHFDHECYFILVVILLIYFQACVSMNKIAIITIK